MWPGILRRRVEQWPGGPGGRGRWPVEETAVMAKESLAALAISGFEYFAAVFRSARSESSGNGGQTGGTYRAR